MFNFLVIFICMLAGLLCKRLQQFPSNASHVLNSFIIYLSLPALVLSQVPPLLKNMSFQGLWWVPVSMAWITFILSFLFFGMIGHYQKWSKAKIGALILTAGLGNTSFVGFPILEAIIGSHAIPIGIIVDQAGSFLVVSTLGILTASMFSGSDVSFSQILKRVISFPPFIALIISLIWVLFDLQYFDFMSSAFNKIAHSLVPLALFSVGFQLKLDAKILYKRWKPLVLGLMFKLVFIPLFFTFLYLKVLEGNDLSTQVTIVESAMASMITSAIVANEFHLDTEIANLMVGISIPISLFSVPLWYHLLF